MGGSGARADNGNMNPTANTQPAAPAVGDIVRTWRGTDRVTEVTPDGMILLVSTAYPESFAWVHVSQWHTGDALAVRPAPVAR